jgi:hypothetical protein
VRPDPMHDPFVEAGYLGYSLRGAAHVQADRTFRPSLEIRDYRIGAGELLYECLFDEWYSDADAAIQRAMGKGRQVIDGLLRLMHPDRRIEILWRRLILWLSTERRRRPRSRK